MIMKVAKAALKLGACCTSVAFKVYDLTSLVSHNELRCSLVNEKDIGFGFPETRLGLRDKG